MKKTRIIAIMILLAFVASVQNVAALDKSRTALAPYFQTDVDSTYTFIGVTHPSLSNAASTVGLTIATVGSSTAASQSFTISASETYRIFIVATNHSTINNLTVTGSEVLFLAMTSGSSDGAAVSFQSSKMEPELNIGAASSGSGSQAMNALSIWGAIVIPGTTSGFAMEFVGDAHDSAQLSAPLSTGETSHDANPYTLGAGHGIN